MRKLLLIFAVTVALTAGHSAASAQKPSAHEARSSAAAAASSDKVDLNSATLDELMRVPSMTEVWAKRIIRYRPFYSKRALLDLGILPSREYDRIKDYVIAHRSKK